jgi:hypothetical protein
MNRLLEEAFRGFALSPLAGQRAGFVNPAWPKLEVTETDKQITVSAALARPPAIHASGHVSAELWAVCN